MLYCWRKCDIYKHHDKRCKKRRLGKSNSDIHFGIINKQTVNIKAYLECPVELIFTKQEYGL